MSIVDRRAERFGDSSVKAGLKTGKRICECAVCGEFFAGVQPFDRHIIGSGTAQPSCATREHMQRMGMTANIHGVWQTGVWRAGKGEVA